MWRILLLPKSKAIGLPSFGKINCCGEYSFLPKSKDIGLPFLQTSAFLENTPFDQKVRIQAYLFAKFSFSREYSFRPKSKAIGLPSFGKISCCGEYSFLPKSKVIGLPFLQKSAFLENTPFDQKVRL